MELDIKRFDPNLLRRKSSVILVIGKRGCGKTTIIKELKSYLDFTNSLEFTPIKSEHVHTKFDSNILKKFIKNQNETDEPGVVILDDMTQDHSTFKSSETKSLIFNSMNYKINVFIAVSYCMDLSPDIRSSVDYIFLLKENVLDNVKKIWKCFGGMFSNFEQFQQIFKNCTENFECLVIDNTTKSYNLNENIFWYKA